MKVNNITLSGNTFGETRRLGVERYSRSADRRVLRHFIEGLETRSLTILGIF